MMIKWTCRAGLTQHHRASIIAFLGIVIGGIVICMLCRYSVIGNFVGENKG